MLSAQSIVYNPPDFPNQSPPEAVFEACGFRNRSRFLQQRIKNESGSQNSAITCLHTPQGQAACVSFPIFLPPFSSISAGLPGDCKSPKTVVLPPRLL